MGVGQLAELGRGAIRLRAGEQIGLLPLILLVSLVDRVDPLPLRVRVAGLASDLQRFLELLLLRLDRVQIVRLWRHQEEQIMVAQLAHADLQLLGGLEAGDVAG